MAVDRIDIETNVKEETLVRQARQGDLKSFSALVGRYQEQAIHAAYSFLGNFEDARDVAQEAFLKAYQNSSHFDGRSRFYTWFYRILVNRCKDFLRKKKARPWILFWKDRHEEGALDPFESIPASGRNALEELVDQEIEMGIWKALNGLPFQQRSVFTLRYLEGLKLEEIAESLSLSVGAVKAHLWQAGQKMKKRLSS